MKRPNQPKGGPLVFMGETFADRNALGRIYPAYTGDDAVRAIENGATTPHEVEVFCFARRQKGAAASRQAARANQAMKTPAVATAERRRKAGSSKGGATMRRKKAA